ncbi:MAG: ArsB/NhaD family transporter [Syntrophomonadaceae bacterium]|nr:ArsB/NhaD family transporter [Syntrophomonadaceae bacterium]
MEQGAIVAVVVFLLAYALIISEKIHRAVVSLAGTVIVIILGVINQEKAIEGVDFNTLGLLIGMMIIVGITRKSGAFEYLAIKSAKVSKGNPIKIMVMLGLITAILSAFLDNVTTVLLIVPVTFSVTERLKINPFPFLMTEVIASNVGGSATLIGDPPNILIGSATHLGFMDFIINLAPVIIIITPVVLFMMVLIFRKGMKVDPADQLKVMELDEMAAIKDAVILKKSLIALAVTISGFFLHQALGLESATVALSGAVLLMLITREEPEEILLAVEWPTLFFFIGLFVLVESLVHTGVIGLVAEESLKITQGDFRLTAMLILWFSGIASAFVDNIPFVTAMIPLLKDVGQLTGMPMDPLWWSLALGACLGGNGTLIGASANVVVAGISEKRGHPIMFVQFLKYGFPVMIVTLILSTAYIYIRYLL